MNPFESRLRYIDSLWIHYYIDDVPWFDWLLRTHDGTQTFECPAFAMDLYRVYHSRFCRLRQHNAPNPAIPSLLAPTKYSLFQAHCLRRNRGYYPISLDK
jgi:hypothetical protein